MATSHSIGSRSAVTSNPGERPTRTVPRRITLFTVRGGDTIIVETLDRRDANIQQRVWNRHTKGQLPEAVISAADFVETNWEGGDA